MGGGADACQAHIRLCVKVTGQPTPASFYLVWDVTSCCPQLCIPRQLTHEHPRTSLSLLPTLSLEFWDCRCTLLYQACRGFPGSKVSPRALEASTLPLRHLYLSPIVTYLHVSGPQPRQCVMMAEYVAEAIYVATERWGRKERVKESGITFEGIPS